MSWLAKYGAPIGILLCFLGLALHVSHTIPPFENSDEAEHFLYAHTIADSGQLPLIVPREQLNEADSPLERWNNHAHHPPLYYLLNAIVINGFDRGQLADYLRPNDLIFTRSITEQNPNKWLHPPQAAADGTLRALYFSRWLNTAFGLITLCLIYKASLIVTRKRGVGLLAMGFAAFLPTFISIHSSVSNDPLVVLTFSAGVTWSLRLLHKKHLSWRDDLLISLILAGAALTKLTGAALWGVVLLALMLAVWRKHIRWQHALQTSMTALLVFAIVAGWWYIRNVQLYGDPLAMDATAAMWGRTFDDIATAPLEEIQRVALSFWMMIGYRHEPLFAPDWFYAVAALIVGGSVFGWLFPRKNPLHWPEALLLLATLSGMIALLIVGTLNVDISYGRLLLPAIIPMALLVAVGWYKLPFRLSPLLLIIYALAAIGVLLAYLPQQYPTLTVAASLPPQTIPTEWRADDLAIVGVEVQTKTISPGDSLQFNLYLQGSHPANPALSATIIDSISGEPIGQADVYPGMAPTDSLLSNVTYHTPVRVPLNALDEPLSPRALLLQLRWYHVDDATWIDYSVGNGTLQDVVLLIDERYAPPAPQNTVDVTFGDAITLQGYTITDDALTSGDELTIHLSWTMHHTVATPHVLTMQLFDSEGTFITQADGPIVGVPGQLWRDRLYISETRTLQIPQDLPQGDYSLRLGWYHLDDWTRWPITGGPTQDGLYILPETLTIRP